MDENIDRYAKHEIAPLTTVSAATNYEPVRRKKKTYPPPSNRFFDWWKRKKKGKGEKKKRKIRRERESNCRQHTWMQ